MDRGERTFHAVDFVGLVEPLIIISNSLIELDGESQGRPVQ